MEWWDARLNAAYGDAMEKARALDRDAIQGTSPVTVAGSLRDMQRAWIAFRDAECVHERSKWGGGTGGGPAEAWCRMLATAEQAVALELTDLGAY